MATKILSVSFANGFVGAYSKSTEAKSAVYLKDLGWSNFQFQQVTESSQFTLQGNDLKGRILITDANNTQHVIDAVINWRTPSGDVSTMVAYATGSTGYTLATKTGPMTIAPLVPNSKTPAHSFLGLTFNGQTLDLGGGTVSGNAAANNVLDDLNLYLANQPQLTVSDISVDEDSGMATVTVTLSKASTDTVTVKYATQDGTATQGKDYTGTSGVLTFGPQETAASFQVALIGNQVADGARSLDIVLSDSIFAAIVDNVGVLTITDNETSSPPPSVQSVASIVAEGGATSVVEGAALKYLVTLSGAAGSVQSHAFALGGEAGGGDIDLARISFTNGVTLVDGKLVVPAGVGSFTLTLPTVDDAIVEDSEGLSLTIGTAKALGTIQDNDTQSVAGIVAKGGVTSAVEGTALEYVVTLSGAASSARSHAFSLGGEAGGGDIDLDKIGFTNGVTLVDGKVVVPAGVTSFTVTVPAIDDSLVEDSEGVILSIGTARAEGTIQDNDTQGVTSIVAEGGAASAVEGTPLTYVVTLSAAASAARSHAFALEAQAGDVELISFTNGVTLVDGKVVVPAGVTRFTVTVPTVDDSLVEGTEILSLSIGTAKAVGAILDNDSEEEEEVQTVTGIVAEGDVTGVVEGIALNYVVTLSGAASSARSHAFSLGGQTADVDLDKIGFTQGVTLVDGKVVVPAGVTSFTVTVPTIDDILVEDAENVILTIGTAKAEGTIRDNDTQTVAGIVTKGGVTSAVEGTALEYVVTLSGAASSARSHAFSLDGQVGDIDLDKISFTNGVTLVDGKVVVPAGVTSFIVTVPTIDDSLVEDAESLGLTIGTAKAEGTIQDNDTQTVAGIVAEQGVTSIVEGSTLKYVVTLSGAASTARSHAFSLGGEASDLDIDRDKISFTNGVTLVDGKVLVPAGVTSFTVTVPTIDDSLVENSEPVELVVGDVRAIGTVLDNDKAAPAPVPQPPVEPAPEPKPPVEPAPEPQPPVQPQPPAPEVPAPPPSFDTGLDPASDDGVSDRDAVTSVRTPEFTIAGSGLLPAGGSVRLLSPEGTVVGSTAITERDVAAGAIKVGPGPLDDGVYTYTAQVMDASGKVIASAPVTVTVVTDLDGVAPSIELAAHGGDFNKDGILDWNQHAVAHMPLRSLADFALGKDAPVAAFGAIMAGSLGSDSGSVQLTQGAQLKDLFLSDLPAALPQEFRAASPVFNFTVGAEADVPELPDLDPSRAGLQTRVVIDLGANGAVSNDFMKFDLASQSWYSFLDDQDLSTFDDGATLVDLNKDGRIDRIVLTLTDGAKGDDDGVADGKIVDPGLLAFDTTPPDQVYSVRLDSGETYYTADITDAQVKSSGTGNAFLGVAFDSMVDTPEAKHVSAFYQPFTQDMSFAIDGQALPYACYEVIAGSSGFFANAAGKAEVDIHLYQNARGLTELASTAQAQELGLAAKGYADRGAQFSVSMDNAFRFDAEGYLIANQENTSVQALVQQLAGMYASTSAAGFIEAVEQNYFEQIKLVGVAHGVAASAADLNAVFGTGFGN